MFRNNNKTLKQKLMQAIVDFQKTLETTAGIFNTHKTVTRGVVSQGIFIKFGYTSQWEHAEKLREYIDLLGSDDKLAMTTKMYSRLLRNRYDVNDDLLASLSRLITKAWDLDERTISASVSEYQRAIIRAQGIQSLFGTGVTIGRAELVTRMSFLRERLPMLGAKRGAEMEMKEVPSLSM